MNYQEAIKLLREIRYFETDAPSKLFDMNQLKGTIDYLESIRKNSMHYAYLDLSFVCADYKTHLPEVLPYLDAGCDYCEHLISVPRLAGPKVAVWCSKGHEINVAVRRREWE